MEKQGMNLFIVDDDKLVVSDLKIYLNFRFGNDINISTFTDGESCLKKIDKDTHIVILDYFLNGKTGVEILKLIKDINPKTEVIMMSSNEDVSLAIQSFRNGASDYVINVFLVISVIALFMRIIRGKDSKD
jgi:DNA-binding NtrC family response regulator